MPQNCVKVDDRDQSITYSDGWTTWDEGKHEFGTISETIQKAAASHLNLREINLPYIS